MTKIFKVRDLVIQGSLSYTYLYWSYPFFRPTLSLGRVSLRTLNETSKWRRSDHWIVDSCVYSSLTLTIVHARSWSSKSDREDIYNVSWTMAGWVFQQTKWTWWIFMPVSRSIPNKCVLGHPNSLQYIYIYKLWIYHVELLLCRVYLSTEELFLLSRYNLFTLVWILTSHWKLKWCY